MTGEIESLRGRTPLLAVVRHSFLTDHYVTVLTIGQDKITLADPLLGLRDASQDAFAVESRQTFILFKPEQTPNE